MGPQNQLVAFIPPSSGPCIRDILHKAHLKVFFIQVTHMWVVLRIHVPCLGPCPRSEKGLTRSLVLTLHIVVSHAISMGDGRWKTLRPDLIFLV